MTNHQHVWGRPVQLDWVKGYNGPVDVYDCACGVRRVMKRKDHPDKPVCDVREVAYDFLQDHGADNTVHGTGAGTGGVSYSFNRQGGMHSPALWMSEQQDKDTSNG